MIQSFLILKLFLAKQIYREPSINSVPHIFPNHPTPEKLEKKNDPVIFEVQNIYILPGILLATYNLK